MFSPTTTIGTATYLYYTLTGTLTANTNLIFPTQNGLYVITDNTLGPYSVTVIMAGGSGVQLPKTKPIVVFANSVTNTICGVAGNSLAGPFAIELFGAVGDGATDDYSAFARAVSYAQLVKGVKILLGAKIYVLNSGVTITDTSGVFFEGLGRGVTTLQRQVSSTDPVISWISSSTSSSRISSGGLEHLTVDANSYANYGVQIKSMVSGTWRDIEIKNGKIHAWYWNCQSSLASGPAGNNGHLVEEIWIDQRGFPAGNGMYLDGDQNPPGSADTSLCTFNQIHVALGSSTSPGTFGDAFVFAQSDSCVLNGLQVYVDPSNPYHGRGLVFQYDPSGGALFARSHFCYGIETSYSGIYALAGSSAISAVANNGSGAIRVTVASTTGISTGYSVTISGVTGTTEANGTWTVTVISSTQLDLISSTYTHTYTGGGTTTWGTPSGPNYVQMATSNGGGNNLPTIQTGALLSYATEQITRNTGGIAGTFVNASGTDIFSQSNLISLLASNYSNSVALWSNSSNHGLLADDVGDQWALNIDRSTGNLRFQPLQIQGGGVGDFRVEGLAQTVRGAMSDVLTTLSSTAANMGTETLRLHNSLSSQIVLETTQTVNVTGTANNGSGAVRLTVTSTAGIQSGTNGTVTGVGGTTGANGTFSMTVISSTQVDLVGSTYNATYTSGGTLTFNETAAINIDKTTGNLRLVPNADTAVVYAYTLDLTSAGLLVSNTKVVGAQNTGWTVPTGTKTRSGFSSGSHAFSLSTAGTTTNGSQNITSVGSTAGVLLGMAISGTGIPANTSITAKTSNSLTISNAATATNTGVALTITWDSPFLTTIFQTLGALVNDLHASGTGSTHGLIGT
jgi:hypothetical protein